MSNISFCIDQRKKELQQTKKLIALGLVGSVGVHAAIALAVLGLYEKPTIAEDPIELIIVEESEPTPEVPKPPVENPQEIPKPKQMNITPPEPQPLRQTEVSNSGSRGGQQQTSTQTPLPQPQAKALPSSSFPKTIQPKAPITPTQPETPPLATSSPLPLATTEQRQPILSDPSQSAPSVTATNAIPANPGASAPSIGSAPGKIAGVSPISGNSQGGNPFGTGLGNTSSGSLGGGNGTGSRSGTGSGANPGSGSSSAVATRSAPPQPSKPQQKTQKEGLRCISECQPPYPSVLNGAEGSAAVQIVIDASGNVVSVTLSKPNNNSQINQQALLAARKMKFTNPPNGDRASVQLTVNFTVAGSEFDRRAREVREQQQRQRQAQEQERKARQAQLEQERLERQRQLEVERQQRERQAQLERERQEQQRQQQLQQQAKPKPQPEIEPPMAPAQPSPTQTQEQQ